MSVKSGTIIESRLTGERIRFLETSADTGGDLLAMEHTFSPSGSVPLAHLHPNQEERFHVISGRPRFTMDGAVIDAGPGEDVVVPPDTPHLFFNPTDAETVVRIELRPALKSEDMFAVLYALARDGRCNRRGIPKSPFWSAVYAQAFRDEVRPTGIVWRALFALSPPAAVAGRRFGFTLPAG